MDGKDLLRRLSQLLLEESGSTFMDEQSSYDYLWEAAKEFVRITHCMTATQSITTTAGTIAYNLNGDFLGLYLKTRDNRHYIKYNDGTYDTFVYHKDYEDVVFQNDTSAVSISNNFTIIDKAALPTALSGTTSSAGAATGGKCVLTDTTADFTDVWPGDIVHNTDDGSDGKVVAKTSTTVISTCLFGGTDDDWTSGDGYVIQPQARYQLVLDPYPSTSSHTITVHYLQRPVPVYSYYDTYRFPIDYTEALVKYAFWLYKYRDSDPDFANKMFLFWDRQLKGGIRGVDRAKRRGAWGVNLKRRR